MCCLPVRITPSSFAIEGLKFVDGDTYAVTGVTKEKIVELVADSHVVSISIAGTLEGTAVTLTQASLPHLAVQVEEFVGYHR